MRLKINRIPHSNRMNGQQSVLQIPYQDLDVNGNIVNKTLISSPVALVLRDPLDGGDGSLNGTIYLGVGIE